ncbi:MAG: putative O-glycosylation ligase, exosortase A system-associated [Pseudomonadota bacterium]|nr:MAG: putative O-glycosylation ligase, exosortase A system-associated [Pseudomonadota bacterium]
MPLRDITLVLFVAAVLPFALSRPHIGILLWTWIGLMNPHKLTWSFAYNMPFGVISGLATLVALFVSREPKRLPLQGPVVALMALAVWMAVTTTFSINTDKALVQWEKVFTIQVFIFITMMVMQTRERIRWLVWVAALSIAFFGVKGGLYTLAGGRGYVLGPPGGFMQGNTEIALALVMTVPLLWYLVLQSNTAWVKLALKAAIVLTAIGVIGTYSRGGLVAILGMSVFLWFKSRKKIAITLIVLMLVPALISLMPPSWFEKMSTIETYQDDSSAMGRINAWGFALNLAKERPFTGGGFETFTRENFYKYAPIPEDFHDAHSIWFEVLGEHGFVGLFLFILVWALTWRTGNRIIAATREREDLRWAHDLAAMIHVSLVGYFVGGSFLGLAYWDYPYVLMALLVVTNVVVQRELAPAPQERAATPQPALGMEGAPAGARA